MVPSGPPPMVGRVVDHFRNRRKCISMITAMYRVVDRGSKILVSARNLVVSFHVTDLPWHGPSRPNVLRSIPPNRPARVPHPMSQVFSSSSHNSLFPRKGLLPHTDRKRFSSRCSLIPIICTRDRLSPCLHPLTRQGDIQLW